ncbi:MAG: polysaccharide biosynthesis/export family protein [Hyphomicrobium sp.]
MTMIEKKTIMTIQRSYVTALIRPVGLAAALSVMLWSFGIGHVSAQGVAENVAGNSEEEYLLGPMDKVRLKVFAWRPSRDEVFEWKALNDVYTVGQSGKISLPLIGDISAAGGNVRDLSTAVGQRMKQALGLVEAPSATVEIVQYRPFYILGSVEHPGEYAYRPNLTIVQAISIAGGLPRLTQAEVSRSDRDTITTAGDARVIQSEIYSLVAKLTRLEAEANGESSIVYPASLMKSSSASDIEPVFDEENRIFDARRKAYESRKTELESMKAVLQQELQASNANLEAQDHYVQLARDEMDQFTKLLERRLTTNARKSEVARNLMQVESERMRLRSDKARVRQELSRLELEAFELSSVRTNQTYADIRATKARLDELRRKMITAGQLLRQSEATTPQLASIEDRPRSEQLTFAIVRTDKAGARVEVAATETTVLQPGDTVKVIPPPRGGAEHVMARYGWGPSDIAQLLDTTNTVAAKLITIGAP